MFDKCIKCERMGESCVPNLMLLPFADLLQWAAKRQKHLGWTNQMLADASSVPIGTINRIKAGDYADARYSTIKHMLIALIGGTTDEFHCTEQIAEELRNVEMLARQSALLNEIKEENARLRSKIAAADEIHRADIRAIRQEYQAQIEFLKEQLKAWQSRR